MKLKHKLKIRLLIIINLMQNWKKEYIKNSWCRILDQQQSQYGQQVTEKKKMHF